ncbi:hypothetical protein N7540_000286 [Penicillium herquei]|nr:hypothetical protein N7540_000286 [Penicillium herquei]
MFRGRGQELQSVLKRKGREELGRALIIDFHRSTLRRRPAKQRPGAVKRRLCQAEAADVKRVRVL